MKEYIGLLVGCLFRFISINLLSFLNSLDHLNVLHCESMLTPLLEPLILNSHGLYPCLLAWTQASPWTASQSLKLMITFLNLRFTIIILTLSILITWMRILFNLIRIVLIESITVFFNTWGLGATKCSRGLKKLGWTIVEKLLYLEIYRISQHPYCLEEFIVLELDYVTIPMVISD